MARLHIDWFYLILALLHVLHFSSNANPPVIHYSHNMRILKIPTHTELGTIVYRIKATDADHESIFFDVLEDFGKTLLRFEPTNHNEANVVLISSLKEGDEYNLTIFATDNQESTYIESRLMATSVPEAQQAYLIPIFLQQNPIYVNENETLNNSIATVRAYDREDSKLPVTFELLENTDLFDFHYVFGPRGMSTAELVLTDKLDFEQQNLYILTLLAINAQANEEVDTRNVHSVQLSIVVRDVQDSPPVFPNLPNVVSLLNDHQKGTAIFNVTAHDGDTVNRRNVSFSILGPQKENFRITNNGSVYLTKSSEYLPSIFPDHQPIQLDIQAHEIVLDELPENESLSSVSRLLVRFLSKNGEPKFSGEHLLGHIDEHSGQQTAVTWQEIHLAHIIDPDEGLNGTVELELIDSTGTFSIEPKRVYRRASFALLINDSSLLDFETRHNISVMIIAKDQSEEMPLTSTVTCTIFIDDINDNYPQFSERVYESFIYENAQEGTSLARISATDKDTGPFGQVRFVGLRGVFASNLAIDAVTGVVRLINSSTLDRELVVEYVVSIEARDNLGTGNLNTTELHIRLLDVNDNPPMFLQPNYLSLLNSDMTEFVQPLQITAIDIDEMNSTNSVVNYEILQGNYEGMFHIDRESGKVSVNTEDTEHVKRQPPAGGSLTLTVRAYDLGLPQMSSSTQIFIYIMNRPNTVRAVFITKKRFNSMDGNGSLEKYLGEITGGNVTINERKVAEKKSDANSIVASVQYRNESTMNLDAIANAFDRLVVRDSSPYSGKLERERETTKNPKRVNMDESISPVNSNGQEVFTSRQVTTASQFGNLDLLLWIMILLILFLLMILIYLFCLLCKDKRKSKILIKETEVPTKVMPVMTNGKPLFRGKRRKVRQVRNANKIVDISKAADKVISVDLTKELTRNGQTSFQVEEETKRGTSSNNNVVTYYEFKRVRYPRDKGIESTQSQAINRMAEHSTSRKLENSQNILKVEDGSQEETRTAEWNAINYVNIPTATQVEPPTVSFSKDPKSVSIAMMQREDSTGQHEGYPSASRVLFERTQGLDLENMKSSYRDLQKKSIFSITYDKVSRRENISAGSEVTT